MAVSAKAQTQPINVVATECSAKFYADDNDLYIVLQNAEYGFAFDVVCAQGAQDIVDGQTYTLTDMLADYSYGVDQAAQAYLNYVSASITRVNGSYTATVVADDGNTYNITYTAVTPITNPTDTVTISMLNANYKNNAHDLISTAGVVQLIGYSDNNDYLMNVVFNATQFAGTYTLADRYEDDQYFMLYSLDALGAETPIPCNNLLEATVTGTASNCTAHIKWVAADSTMYDISFAYADPTVQSQQTFVATDLTITQNPDYALYQMFYGVYAYDFEASDGTNILHGTVYNENADNALGTWTFDEGATLDFNLYDATTGVASAAPFNGTITIAQAQDSSYTLTGTSLFYNNVEWTFNCSFVIVPEDTVAIVMDNEEVNMVYDHTTDGEDYFTLYGADQNVEYLFQLGVYASGQMAGTYTQNDVELEATTLTHFTETDTTTVEIAEVRDFTVLGDSTGCSTYIEILSTDLVLYKITYTYGDAPEPPVSVENVNEPEFVIVSENNAIVVYTAAGEDIMVCDMTGRIIMNGKTASDVERINVAVPGVYVVRICNRAVNVLVK